MSYEVFIDVDETLIDCKTLLDTFRYHLCSFHGAVKGQDKFNHVISLLADAKKTGINDRASLNRIYYQHFAGVDVKKITHHCEHWFKVEGVSLLKSKVLDEIKRHQNNNARIVLVSGSYRACLEPLSRYIRADAILCTELVSVEGVFNGEISDYPIIGEGKAKRIQQYLEQYRLSSRGSFAYGDHLSDVPMLELADERVIVDNHALFSALKVSWPELTHIESSQTSRMY